MKKKLTFFLLTSCLIALTGCKYYSFTGGNVGDAKTIQVDFFPNQASIVEPVLSQRFTQDLQDLFTRQTNLTLIKKGGDLRFEGEITGYNIVPTSATSDQRASQNRLTITVAVRFFNKLNEKDDFEREFSFYESFPANQNLVGATLDSVLDTILERITQDIFNASVAKW